MYNKYFVGLIALIVALVVVSPALAMPNPSIYPMPYGGHNQYTSGYINGNGNDQVVYSEHTDNNYNGKVNQKAISDVDGDNNNVNTVNNAYTVNGDVTNGANAVNNQQSVTVNLPKSTAYYGLDTGIVPFDINRQIISLYLGQVLIAQIDETEQQMEGDKYLCTVWSSLPVHTSVVNNNQVNRVLHDDDVAPAHDDIRDVFDTGNLDAIYVAKYRSPQQQFIVTIPESGWYSMSMDTRVSQSKDGKQTSITADSVDIVYEIKKIKSGSPDEFKRKVIGNIETFKVREDGTVDTTQSVIGKI